MDVDMSTTDATSKTTPRASTDALTYDVFVNDPPPQDGLLPNGSRSCSLPWPAR